MVVLTFEAVDEILWFTHLNETSLAVLSTKWKLGFVLNFDFRHYWELKG